MLRKRRRNTPCKFLKSCRLVLPVVSLHWSDLLHHKQNTAILVREKQFLCLSGQRFSFLFEPCSQDMKVSNHLLCVLQIFLQHCNSRIWTVSAEHQPVFSKIEGTLVLCAFCKILVTILWIRCCCSDGQIRLLLFCSPQNKNLAQNLPRFVLECEWLQLKRRKRKTGQCQFASHVLSARNHISSFHQRALESNLLSLLSPWCSLGPNSYTCQTVTGSNRLIGTSEHTDGSYSSQQLGGPDLWFNWTTLIKACQMKVIIWWGSKCWAISQSWPPRPLAGNLYPHSAVL